MSDLHPTQVADFTQIAIQAGRIALQDFRPGERTSAKVEYKGGGSPVTAADIAANASIRDACAKAFHDCGWFSEETVDTPARLAFDRLIIADPIDGTRAFASGDPNWCVSLALVEAGRPILGVLYAPALNDLYVAVRGQGASLNGSTLSLEQRVSQNTPSGVAFGPKPMVEWLNGRLNLDFETRPKVPSLALRMAKIAAGHAELGLASQNAHDWDIAAADLILCESGGMLIDFYGREPVYNATNPVHPALLAAARPLARSILQGMSDLRAAE